MPAGVGGLGRLLQLVIDLLEQFLGLLRVSAEIKLVGFLGCNKFFL